jgi:hypothetical protein
MRHGFYPSNFVPVRNRRRTNWFGCHFITIGPAYTRSEGTIRGNVQKEAFPAKRTWKQMGKISYCRLSYRSLTAPVRVCEIMIMSPPHNDFPQ